MVALLDAATDRIGLRRSGDFDAWVEAVRVGTVVAHDKKAAAKWRRAQGRRTGRKSASLTGAALEAAVMGIAAQFPDNVVHGAA